MTKAVVLLSGGLDSTVVLALAIAQKIECHTLSFHYGQNHLIELERAQAIAAHYKVSHRIITIDPQVFKGSSLTNSLDLSATLTLKSASLIPTTYVPARNTLFLSYALGYCEHIHAQEIHFGPNRADIKGYPDCRPAYLKAFEQVMQLATKQAVSGQQLRLITPLIDLDKHQIIRKGLELNAPLDQTFSCYFPNTLNEPCQQCDACLLREEGFKLAKHHKH